MGIFDKAKQKFQDFKKRSALTRLIQFTGMGAGNWGNQKKDTPKLSKARKANNWPQWLRLYMPAGRSFKKPGPRDTSGHGSRVRTSAFLTSSHPSSLRWKSCQRTLFAGFASGSVSRPLMNTSSPTRAMQLDPYDHIGPAPLSAG